MTNIIILMVLMLLYGIVLIIVIDKGFDKIIKHESKLSNYMRNIDEFKDLVNKLDEKEPKDIIFYRINKIKNFIKKLRNG